MIIGRDSTRISTIDDLLDPRLLRVIDGLDLASRRLMSGTMPGERRAKRRGSSVEFDDFREYTDGDDLRHVDWNIAARFDRLVVKLFREEQDLSLHIMLDLSPSMCAGVPSKALTAARLSMALAYLALARNNRVHVSFVGLVKSVTLAPMRGRTSIHTIARELLNVWPSLPYATPGQLIHDDVRHALSAASPRGVIVLFSDVLDAVREAQVALTLMRRLSQGGEREAFIYQVLAASELDPTLDAAHGIQGDVQLIDIERATPVDATITPLASRHAAERARAFVDSVSAAARANAVHHRVLATSDDLAEILLHTLRRDRLLA
ncbi:MAG: DUF58 domain-containing protein [Planctomycetes bacterium]|nr:DUF58 domain-containing protein [Planctomycetota bacterium]